VTLAASVALNLALVGLVVYLVRQAAGERATLLQRIQAPEAAVAAHHREERPRHAATVIALGDDEAMIGAAGQGLPRAEDFDAEGDE
jgi:hypothetical protein